MSVPSTGETKIDVLLQEVISKGFILNSSGNTWKLTDPEHNELGFDPKYTPSIPLLERLLQDASKHGSLCHARETHA